MSTTFAIPHGQLEDGDWSRAERWLLIAAALTFSALLPVLIVSMIDMRLINGINPWIKPAKFLASTALHLATLAVLLRLLQPRYRVSKITAWLAIGTIISATLENAYITLQAGRGRHSHYNLETAWEATAYSTMAVGAVYLIAVAGLLGLAILVIGRRDIGPGLKHGAAWGLMLGFVSTLIVAGYMGGHEAGHWVGGQPTDANGLPVVGWARDGGDLRVAHFFSLHMMQALPVLGWLADRITPIPRMLVGAGALVGCGAVTLTFLQALEGQPFL